MQAKKYNKIDGLSSLVELIQQTKGFSEILTSLKQGNSATIDGAWGSACALAAVALASQAPQVLLVVLPKISELDDFVTDITNFSETEPTVFPAWESLPEEHQISDIIFGERLRVLKQLEDHSTLKIIVTTLPALLQPVPNREEQQQAAYSLEVGQEIELEELLKQLVERQYQRVPAISMPGEFSLHGGILDLFAPNAEYPFRFEFFGDEIESIRSFDVESQRKIEDLNQADLMLISPVGNLSEPNVVEKTSSTERFQTGESFLDFLPTQSWVALVDFEEIHAAGKDYLARLKNPQQLFSLESIMARAVEFPTIMMESIPTASLEASCHLQIESIERFTGPKSEVLQELATITAPQEQLLIACHNQAEQERLSELLQACDTSFVQRVTLCLGRISHGFRMVSQSIVVLDDHELFGRTNIQSVSTRRSKKSRAIDSFLELQEGDLIVHLTHGIGKYLGMKLLEKEDQVEEHLMLEFRDRVLIYVPVSLIHLVQKYIGTGKLTPPLSKIGSQSWSKKKQAAANAVLDLASDMIQLQAKRDSRPGLVTPPDSQWQREFEAAFQYTPTLDQVEAIRDLKHDLEQHRPMDRLICGDVGYGKTEVAMRAAFKVIDAGRQVAVLVPTTVLAEQHLRTFSERMAEYPIAIDVLSRFRTRKQQRQILAQMEEGSLDLVIGTHRLVQKDIQFKNLGLLIIDEEQRFGVEAKEMLKQLKLEIDVLTLSATPIPRTLHMAILGIRDISNLTTAPQDRHAIETRISRFDPELIRSAMIRELNRNGQIYFVHNRVYNIQSITDRLQSIVPEARFCIAHGQMKEAELERSMMQFVSREADVLVCTTIIESGLDIPNANTIFIHQADRYGLADLHQLRGRVGRYKHRAYCYLILDEHQRINSVAVKRLKAIEEFSQLGAGFKIALRDLEIRGAGNILGTEQSGHIASVGYELYCQLLEKAVKKLKNEPVREIQHVAIDLPISAYLPESYVPPGRHKIEVYRKLSNLNDLEELNEFRQELQDRFGLIPPMAENLLELKELQILAQFWQIDSIYLEDSFLVLRYRDRQKINVLVNNSDSILRIVDQQKVYHPLQQSFDDSTARLVQLKNLLQFR